MSKLIQQVLSFFLGSLAGVTVDLAIFQAAVHLGIQPFWANTLSSGLAIMTTYLLVTRYTFDISASFKNFIFFLAWYASSITVFSILIEYFVTITAWPAIACKVGALPFSFAVNFLFSHFFLGRNK